MSLNLWTNPLATETWDPFRRWNRGFDLDFPRMGLDMLPGTFDMTTPQLRMVKEPLRGLDIRCDVVEVIITLFFVFFTETPFAPTSQDSD